MEAAFLQQMRTQPDDAAARLIFADWLEERGDPRGELARLSHALTQAAYFPARTSCENRLRELAASGVKPIAPRWVNSLDMPFVWVPAGVFLMGSPPHESDRQEDEGQREVVLTRGFYMGAHPVTQAQWRAVTGDSPGCFRGDDLPVECVSWEDCQAFCQALARKDGLGSASPSPYRLPTEAEWEYACRAGTSSPYYHGKALTSRQANYHANYAAEDKAKGRRRQQTTPAAAFPPNAWDLHDMHGNVFEWCADWYGAYPPGPASDPVGARDWGVRVLRGGSWHSLAPRCRSACRGWGAPGYRGSDVGCRVCFRLDSDYSL